MPRPATQAKPVPTMETTRAMPVWLAAALLALVTLVLYWPATSFDFINLDDPGFASSNVHVQAGLTWEGVKWAFQLNQGDYWHPLTWLSLMLDSSLFGDGPRGFHLTNVVFHAANGVLLFLLLRSLTGAFWRSLAVASLFALHPLRVESVAWVTERKDVLSGCFGLLALIFYARYASRASNQWSVFSNQSSGACATEHPSSVARLRRVERSLITDHRLLFYLLSLFFFACGLMTKAMLVTWPFVMLLLDYWPLRRLEPSTLNSQLSTIGRLVREKTPFFLLGVISCFLTYLTERARRETADAAQSPMLFRFENASVAYARYLGKTFWPANLAVPYANASQWSWLEVGSSVLVVVGVSLIALRWWRRPYLLVGWCWFLGTLIPVIGLTKGWGVFMADRFTYLPSIGVLILIVWGVCDLTLGRRYQVPALSLIGVAAMLLCLASTHQQISYWRDSETLFRHALEVTRDNYLACESLGYALAQKGQDDKAIPLYQEAIRLRPDFADAHNDLGVALGKKGKSDEAIWQYQEALRLKPTEAMAHYNLGIALANRGQLDEGIRHFQEAISLKPDDPDFHNNLGDALDKQGHTLEAIRQYREAIRLKPSHADAHNNLGAALADQGEAAEAIREYKEAIRLKPIHADAHNNLGVALGKQGQAAEAIKHFQDAIRLKPDHIDAHYNLGVVLASNGQMEESVRQLQEVIRLKPDHAEAHNNLGVALFRQGRGDEAIRQLQEALRLKPDYPEARKNLETLGAQAPSSPPPGAPSGP